MDIDINSGENPIREILNALRAPINDMIGICDAINDIIPDFPADFVPRTTNMLQSQSQIGTRQVAQSSVATAGPPAEEWQTKRLLGSAWGSSKNAISKLGEGIGSTIMVPTKIAGAALTGTGDILTGLGKLPNDIARQTAKIKIKSPFSGGGKSPRGYKKINNNTKKKK